MTAYNPGDIIVYQLIVGGLDFYKNFISFDIYESIQTPGIVANITILDVDDYLGQQQLKGGEPVSIAFESPGSVTAQYNLVVNRVSTITQTPSLSAKSYIIEAVSREVLTSKSKYVTKKYENKQYSSMAQDVFKSYLGSSRPLEVEQTKGMQKYTVQNEKPLTAIDSIRRRSVSSNNKSSTYLFFENRYGYHFVTLEKLFRDHNVVKNLVQDAATGYDFLSSKGNNIIAYEAKQQMNVAQVTGSGGLSGLYGVFNMFTRQYSEKKIGNPLQGLSAGGNIGSLINNTLSGDLGGEMNQGIKALMAVANEKQIGLGGKSGIPEAEPVQHAYAAAVDSTLMSICTVGDSVFTAGVMVNASIIKKVDLTTPRGNEFGLTGDFLISNLRQMCKPPGHQPRFVSILECVKGALEGG